MRAFVLLLIITFFMPWAASAQSRPTRYLVSLPDIPLMQQMQEIKDSGVVFDKAEGRIVQEMVKANGLTTGQIESFYNEALPALGWTQSTGDKKKGLNAPQNTSRFSRNGEQLVVNLEKLGSEGLVVFAVSPIQR